MNLTLNMLCMRFEGHPNVLYDRQCDAKFSNISSTRNIVFCQYAMCYTNKNRYLFGYWKERTIL